MWNQTCSVFEPPLYTSIMQTLWYHILGKSFFVLHCPTFAMSSSQMRASSRFSLAFSSIVLSRVVTRISALRCIAFNLAISLSRDFVMDATFSLALQLIKLNKNQISAVRGLRTECYFPGTGYFPKKIREISRPEHSGTSYSRSWLSTGIRDWLFPGLV